MVHLNQTQAMNRQSSRKHAMNEHKKINFGTQSHRDSNSGNTRQ